MSMVFCRGCGKEIHETATACPHCGAPQGKASLTAKVEYKTYAEVPWFRKWWFTTICFLIFTPAMWVVFATGGVYYEKKGELQQFSPIRKIVLTVISLVLIYRVFAD